MLKTHDDMINSTNELINQTHVRYEKEIQQLEKEIQKKDAMNMIMQEVLIKLIRATWNVVDVPNNKFDEMLVIIDQTFTNLKGQAPIAEAYDALSKQINMSFQKVFKRLSELQSEARLASDSGPSHTRGGEGICERER